MDWVLDLEKQNPNRATYTPSPFCGNLVESVSHFFVTCELVLVVWYKILEWLIGGSSKLLNYNNISYWLSSMF